MQNLDVFKKDSGKIWQRKAKPGNDGLILTIVHSASNALSQSRNVRFLHTAFDASGERFVGGDYQGNVFMFDIHNNRFSLVQKTGSPCSALAFALQRRTEFLVATSDYALKCFDTDSKELVALMKGHDSIIHSISLHASGRYAITTSIDTAQLWDLDSFERKRKLNVKENVGILKVFFLSTSNTILTCFKDDSIFAWESETLACKYQLHVPDSVEKPAGFKTFASTRDGRLLVGGGRSRFLHVWSLDNQTLLRVVELPRKVTSVLQIEFLPDAFDSGSNQVLGVLSQDGIVRFININTFSQLFDIGRLDDRVNNFAVCPVGRHVAAVMDSGSINVYSTNVLSQELNKPPPPLVKVVKANRMSETTSSSLDSRQTMKKKSLKSASHSTTTDQAEMLENIGLDRLMAILRGYGEYPAKYRMFIWRTILQLPENHSAYAALVEKGTHPSYENLHEHYPIKSRKLLRVLQRVLSALAHWSPIFGETDYLPLLAFPFVKLFQNNQLVCFEIVATILSSWCQHWFEYFPNPPINMLALVENVLAFHDKELLQHFVSHGVTSQIYAWPVLETLFSEVLTREEWLKLMDNIFSNHPSFLVMIAVAYSIVGRSALMHSSELDDFKYYYHHRNAMSISQLLVEAYRLSETTPDDIHPRNVLEDFVQLPKGQYPIFNKYPKFIVDFQVQEKERIRKEEEQYMQQKTLAVDLRQQTQKRQQEEEGWYRQQQLLLEAEQVRRSLIVKEEQKLADQRIRLAAMNREMKMKELQLLDATRRKFMAFTQQQKEAELSRLDDEIRRKAELRDVETQAAIEEVEIKNMELQLQKKLFEQELHREHIDLTERQKADYAARSKKDELRNKSQQMEKENSLFQNLQTKMALLQNLSQTDQLKNDADQRLRTEYRQTVEEMEKERNRLLLEKLDKENEELEESIQKMIKQVDAQKQSETRLKLSELSSQPPRSLPGTPSSRMQAYSTYDDEPEERFSQSSVSSRDDEHFLNLDRGRRTFDEREQQLLSEVRNLRQKWAKENRLNKPMPPYSLVK